MNGIDREAFLRACRIHIHHVGGRGGDLPFPFNQRFAKGFEIYLYDADPACLEEMTRHAGGARHIINAAIAGEDGSAVLHVNYDPFTSSLLPARKESAAFYYQDKAFDYVLGDVLSPARTLSVATRTIGGIAQERGFAIDFLSLDVQGVEYDVLAAGPDDALVDMIGVYCEVSFLPFYQGHRQFDEIMSLLRKKGFFMARFFPHGFDWETKRTGIGWRGKGFTTHGDALFLREPAEIRARTRRPFASLLKAAYMALCFDHVAYALDCLAEAFAAPDPEVMGVAEALGYVWFLDMLYWQYRREPEILPPRFTHHFTMAESLARFEPSDVGRADIATVRARYFADNDEAAFREAAPRLMAAELSTFERMLAENGFGDLAMVVARRRLETMATTLAALGLEIHNGRVVVKG